MCARVCARDATPELLLVSIELCDIYRWLQVDHGPDCWARYVYSGGAFDEVNRFSNGRGSELSACSRARSCVCVRVRVRAAARVNEPASQPPGKCNRPSVRPSFCLFVCLSVCRQ